MGRKKEAGKYKGEYVKEAKLALAYANQTKYEQRVTAFALTELNKQIHAGRVFSDEELAQGIELCFSAKEFRDAMIVPQNRHSLYDDLRSTAESLESKKFTIETEDKGQGEEGFITFPLIKTAGYSKRGNQEAGIFLIKFHELASPMLVNRSSKFVPLLLENVMSYKSSYTIRLYEILKSKQYRMKNHLYEWEIGLVELRLMLGCIDMQNKKVKEILKKGYKTETQLQKALEDIDKNMSLTDKKARKSAVKYPTYPRFREKVLERSREELLVQRNLPSAEVCYEYEAKSKEGHRITHIKFYIIDAHYYDEVIPVVRRKMNGGMEQESLFTQDGVFKGNERLSDPGKITLLDIPKYIENGNLNELIKNADSIIDAEEVKPETQLLYKSIISMAIAEQFGIVVKAITVKNIAEACNYKMAVFLRNMDYTFRAQHVKDVEGYLVDACKRDYASAEKKPHRGKAKDPFTEFQQREYDFDKLEQELLSDGPAKEEQIAENDELGQMLQKKYEEAIAEEKAKRKNGKA